MNTAAVVSASSHLLQQARALNSEMIAWRRDFHQYPEIGFEEIRTGRRVAEFCAALGLEVRRLAGTGVVATLNAGKPGPALALRADMDALPMQEENTGIDYASSAPGRAHLCGHDAHTAMLMGAVRLLAAQATSIPFPVRFLFQPAEEIVNGGAERLIAEGALDGVGEIFGVHTAPMLPTGTIGIRPGPFMASMNKVEITVEGQGGHGAFPHCCHDPILTGVEIVMALQSLVSRRVDPLDPAVVSITQFHAGSAFNIIPARAQLGGTVRHLSPELAETMPRWIEEVAGGVAKAHGLTARVAYQCGTPVLVNEAGATARLSAAFAALGGKVREMPPSMGGEDFAYYLQKVPGAFAFLGAGDGTSATASGFHHPCYNIDEAAMPWGAALLAGMVLGRLTV